ncbi:hypothetical protein KAZ57_02105 [Patescibacteria group bacterium]|nr:hypothetical protein [Patescibacteria group bacterium]
MYRISPKKALMITIPALIILGVVGAYRSNDTSEETGQDLSPSIKTSKNQDTPFSAIVGKETSESLAKTSNDARRQQDLTTISTALKLALIDKEIKLANTAGCVTCSSDKGSNALDGSGWIKFEIMPGKVGLSKYLKEIPKDPINSGLNVYTFAANGIGFEISTVLESLNNAKKMETDKGSSFSKYEVGTNLTLVK